MEDAKLRDAFCSVLIGDENSIAFWLPDSQRTAHVAMLGKSRFGKTTVLEHLVLSDMHHGTAAIVIDAHGDLSKRLIALAPFENREKPDDPRSKVVLVEPNTERSFGLNLYECSDPTDGREVTATVGRVVEIFRKLMGTEGTGYLPLIESGLRNTARAIIANGFTMAELPLLYRDASFRHDALAALSDPGDYWREYEASSPQKQQDKREPVLNKVARFLEDDLVASMVKQSHNTIPFMPIMENGGTLILNLAGLDRETVSFLGMVFLSVFSNLIHQREKIPLSQRKRVHLYLDEYGRFATPTTKRLLEEGGKYGLGVTIAHQNLGQTPEHEALEVQTLICFQLGAEDAHEVAGSFDCTPIRTKRVARQRTEPQYREWEEDVWDSEESRSHYDGLCQAVAEAESRHHKLKATHSYAWQTLKALYPSGDSTPALHKFDSSDATVNGVYMLNRLRRDGGDSRKETHELRNILTYLYDKYGREPHGEEFWEAHQWLDRTATKYEEDYEETDRLLPDSYEEFTRLKSTAERFYRQHTSRERRTEYIGETPVKDDSGRVIYDNIEEIDQTHADRRAEIANMLTQLPRYVAYCKTVAAGGKPRDHRVRMRLPAPLPTYDDYQRQTETQDQKTRKDEHERDLRRRGLYGIDPDVLAEWSGLSPEIHEASKQLEASTIEWAQKFVIAPEARLQRVRSHSRDCFGVPPSEIQEQVRKRQMKPPPDDGQPARPTPKPKGPPPPSTVAPPPGQTIGRRSPKERG
ncbi:type IV secretory system conjugative DNA transfer family protein [Streptomyces graminilatus]|uniref:type IV secretory system conjugative DNA transfer family protein n=1 Tax=Streptomyces graminilatus TaxID=1464070 RepID=UPI0012FF1BDF|nr:type IV secretion system DNA-binding domain-containing protein [Streptomyces graminilatus]